MAEPSSRPQLEAFLFATELKPSRDSRFWTLRDTFDHLTVPAGRPKGFFIFTKWAGAVGRFTQGLTVRELDGTITPLAIDQFELVHPLKRHVVVTAVSGGFAASGEYRFRLTLDGEPVQDKWMLVQIEQRR